MVQISRFDGHDLSSMLKETDPRSFVGGFTFAMIYIWTELKRQPGAYIWSIATVFQSVQVLSVIISALSRSSLIFFRIAEKQVGEQDIIYTPGLSVDGSTAIQPSPLPLLNQTIMDLALAGRGTPYEPKVLGFDGNLRRPNLGLTYKNGYAGAGASPAAEPDHASKHAWIGGVGSGPHAYYDGNAKIRLDSMPTNSAGELRGVAGRFLMPVSVSDIVRNDGWNPQSQSPLSSTVVKGTMAGIDSAREWFLALGRKFSAKHTNVPQGSVFLARSVLRGLGADDSVIKQMQHEASERQKHHWDYAIFDEVTQQWTGGNHIPLFSAKIKPDLAFLLNGAGVSRGTTTGNGTRTDPYVVPLINIDGIFSLLESSGVPAPNNMTWTEWADRPVATFFGSPSTWFNYTRLDEFINNNVPAEARNISTPIVMRVPLEEICRQRYIKLISNMFQVGEDFFTLKSTLPCVFGYSPVSFDITVNPLGNGPVYTYEVDTVALDASYQAYLDNMVVPGPSVKTYVTAMISTTLAASPPMTLSISDVVDDPQGKYAKSLGGLILSEMASTVYTLKMSIRQTLTLTVKMDTLVIDVNVIARALNSPIVFPQNISASAPIQLKFQLASLLQLNMTEIDKALNTIQGQELVPAAFGMIGFGANAIGNAYDAKFWNQAKKKATYNKVGPGLYSTENKPCPPCYCEWTPICTLASIHQTISSMAYRVLEHTPFGNYAPSPDQLVKNSGVFRQSAYSGTSNAMTQALSSASASAGIAQGALFPAKTNLILFEAVKASLFMRHFIDAVLIALVFVVLFLAVQTNYALCSTDTESHTFTFAMIRASGLSSMQLAVLLLLKATIVAIIGSLTGLVGGALIMIPVGSLLDGKTESIDTAGLTVAAIAVAIVAGLLVPFASTIIPVQKALGYVLVEALIPHRTSLSAVTITLEKLSDLGINVYTSAAAVMLIIYGFICFYLIPLAFVNNDIPMFLTLLMLILLAMILGLVMIVYLFIPKLASMFAWLATIKQPSTRKIVTQHLRAHWEQSKWYALHVCITVSFIVFTGTLLRLQTHSLSDMIRVLNGSHIVINSPNTEMPLPVAAIRSVAEEQQSAPPGHPFYNTIQGHSFVTYPLSMGAKGTLKRQTRVSSLLQFPQLRQAVYGVDSNYANSIYEHLYEEKASVTKGSALRKLQDDGGAGQNGQFMTAPLSLTAGQTDGRLINSLNGLWKNVEADRQKDMVKVYDGVSWGLISKAIQKSLGVDVNSLLTVQASISYNSEDENRKEGISNSERDKYWFVVKPRGVASRVPGFFFSNYDMLATAGSVLLHKDAYARVASVKPEELIFQRCMVKIKKNVPANVREDLVQMLMRAASGGAASDASGIQAIDTEGLVDTMVDAAKLLEILFTSLGVVVMVLAGIMGLVTVQSIVRSQTWEIAVLRSLGMKRTHVLWIYSLETLVLGISAIILGTIIGLIVGISLTLLFNMFTDSPFTMDFPIMMYLIMIGAGLLISLLATVVPTWVQTSPAISTSLRKM